MALLPIAARSAGVFEKYVLSVFFLNIAFGKVVPLRDVWLRYEAGNPFPLGSLEFTAVLLNALTFLFGVFFGLSLLLNRRALQDPQRWREIIIPLIATFMLYAFTGLSPYMPAWLTQSLLPIEWQRTASITAIEVSLVGYAIALWSVLYLGRSLSLVVSVRALKSNGPYRFVRHPMYLGYLVLVLGLAIASSSYFAIVLWVTYLVVTVYRAHLEEETLTAFSAEYRDYARRTGFLLPGIGRLGGPAVERPRTSGPGVNRVTTR